MKTLKLLQEVRNCISFPLSYFHILLHNEHFVQNAYVANQHAGGLCNFTTRCFKKPVNYTRALVLSLCKCALISNATQTPRGFMVDVYCLAYEDSTRG